MTEKQKHLLQLFSEIDKICKEYNLRYVMAGGSLIGVVRNEGFIPWDDDIDIYMPRDDWEKFVELAKTELPPDRAVQCVDVDREYTNTFPRYASTDSCAIHRHQIIGNDKAGEIVDVLTLDPIPADDKEYEKYRTHLMIYSDLINLAVVYGNRWEVPVHLYLKYLLSYIFLGRDRTLKKLENIMFSYKEEDCDRYAMRWGGCPFLFDKEMMFPVKYGKFEGIDVMIPNLTADYLTWHYGDEWSYIPPHGDRESHDAVTLDGVTYEEFRKEYMPKINKFKLRFDSVIRKIYYMATAKQSHRLMRKRQLLLGKSIEMDLKARMKESGVPLKELLEKRDYKALNNIFGEYYRVQLSADFIGREDFVNIYNFYHPVLIEVEDEVFTAAMLTLMYSERISKAFRMMQLRTSLSHSMSETDSFMEDIKLFRKAVRHYEFGEMKEAEALTDRLLEKYQDNPSFLKFKSRFVIEEAKERQKYENAEEFINKCLKLFPKDGYFLKYQGELLWMKGECRDALEIFAQVRELTNNGITQLEIDKFLEEYKNPAMDTICKLSENGQTEEAMELAELWAKLLPEDKAVDGHMWFVKVLRADTQSSLKEVTDEIVKIIEKYKREVSGNAAENGEIRVHCQALAKAWERLGYPKELAGLRIKLLFTDSGEELELLAEQIRSYSIAKDRKAEVSKLLGDARMKQGQTRKAFENYVEGLKAAHLSYVKKELAAIILDDFIKGSKKAAAYARKMDAGDFLDGWLDKYESIENIQEIARIIL